MFGGLGGSTWGAPGTGDAGSGQALWGAGEPSVEGAGRVEKAAEEPPFAGGAADDMMAAIAGEAALGALGGEDDGDDDETFGGEPGSPRPARAALWLRVAVCSVPQILLRRGAAQTLWTWRRNSSKNGVRIAWGLVGCWCQATWQHHRCRRLKRNIRLVPTWASGSEHWGPGSSKARSATSSLRQWRSLSRLGASQPASLPTYLSSCMALFSPSPADPFADSPMRT